MEIGTKKKKMIYLVSNFSEQMVNDYLEEKDQELFESLISDYKRENKGIILGHDISDLTELEEKLKSEDYVISCYIKSVALRNELKRLFGIDMQFSKSLVSKDPGDMLFTVNVINLPKLYEYKEDVLPEGSKLKIKKWWIVEN